MKQVLKTFKEYLEQIGHVPKVARSRYEVSDPVPVALPLGYVETPDIVEQVRMMLRRDEFTRELSRTGIDETFDEADDFDVGDDDDLSSPYEENFEPAVYVKAPTEEERKMLETPREPPAEDVSKTDVSPDPGKPAAPAGRK